MAQRYVNSKFGDIETSTLRHIWGHGSCHNPNTSSHGHGMLQFKRHPSSSFNSESLSLLRS